MQTPSDAAGKPLTKNQHLLEWVDEMARLTKPDRIVWCDGSEEEKHRLTEEAVAKGILIPLNQQKLPGCYLHRSQPERRRARRAAHLHLHAHEGRGGPHQQLDGARRGVQEARRALRRLDEGPHDVRRPLRHGARRLAHLEGRRRAHRQRLRRAQHAHHDPHGQAGARSMLGDSNDFNRGLHSTLDCNPERRFICHFPQDNTIWSVGSGYGGNVLLGKKCLALRIGSYLGKQRGLARRAHAHPRRRDRPRAR